MIDCGIPDYIYSPPIYLVLLNYMELREATYHICQIRGFFFLGKLAYLLYYHLLSLLFWLTPQIRSLYVIGSVSSGDFVPGLSDIDFILVIKEMSAEVEYRFIKSLNKKIWYLMPPIGKEKIGSHIFIYSLEEWSILGDLYLGKRFGSIQVVFDKENITLKKKYSQVIQGLDHFYKGQYRLRVIQQYLFSPNKSRFIIAFLRRTVDRCKNSAISGYYEATHGLSTLPNHRIADNEINDIVGQISNSNAKDPFESIFSKLYLLFHLAIEKSHPFYQTIFTSEDLEIQFCDDIDKQRIRTRELVDEIFVVLKDAARQKSILVSRTHKVDFFLIDLRDSELLNKLIEHYRSKNLRILRIFSKAWFTRLYLNFPIHPIYFYDLHDHSQRIFNGYFDRSRFIIESNIIFSKIRSPKNLKDTDSFKSIQNQILDQIKLIENHTEISKNRDGLKRNSDSDSKMDLNALSEYERFVVLRETSLILRKNILEFLYYM